MITLRGHTFMTAPLSAGAIVLDLGANKGNFSARVGERFGCRCIAVEANPELVPEIAKLPGVRAVHAAIAPHDGEIVLNLNSNSESSTILESKSAGGMASGTADSAAGSV